ncbi:adhesion G protein-coupled receptor A3 isoform X2 [Sitophilus oryzae]|uniref:Adhesion G protein-coupled receptor A3 isoform X2 n=1 Tax=Sitophilus oryzae TaxID=7048 RepID=A0A6J2XVM9_SITOR|nr:adhesion G protein-coupled receptor A3 isoform X2 [Sitophilus oryzae]
MKFVIVPCVMLFLRLFCGSSAEDSPLCSSKCTCKPNSQRDGANYLKMTCGETEKISHLDELELLNIASELFQLNLSNNNLKTFSTKVELIALQKLNLSGNQLTELQEHQFREVPHLRRLDLSENSIKHIDIKSFEGLKHLERLKLNHNELTSITMGTFDVLPNLKQLDLSNNPLQCDCGLLWVLEYIQKHSVKLISNPKCNTPPSFKGLPLRKLRVGVDIHCKSSSHSNGLPLIDLKPETNQIVFEGDYVEFHCRAPSMTDTSDDSRLKWLWSNLYAKDNFKDISISTKSSPSTGLIDSVLVIKLLKSWHTGVWGCLFTSIQGNHSKSISVTVISENTRYCPIVTSKGNKGTYTWPKTVLNNTVTVPCEFLNLNYDPSLQRASYFCSDNGTWMDLDTSHCSYISDITRIFEQFSKVNSSILESARHFKNYTSNVSVYTDPVDLVYTVETMENYAALLSSESLKNILMDVTSNLMNLPWEYLRDTDQKFRSCSKLVNIMESVSISSPGSLFQRENMIIESFPMTKEAFSGIRCSWLVNPLDKFDSIFSCNTNNLQDSRILQGKIVEASVIISDALLSQVMTEGTAVQENYNLLISMLNSSKFFPIDDERKGKEGVTSTIVGVKLDGFLRPDVTHPIKITIRAPPSSSSEVTPFTPVHWDQILGRWSTEGCRYGHHIQDHVVFTCKQLGYYGLLQDVTYLNVMDNSNGFFRLSHPAIYVGNSILFLSLLIAILTYILGFASIQMPKKAKHCLINTWTSVALLCFMYSFGIYQTEDQKLCQAIGMVLHYFSLCSMLWMCVGINSMYKRLSKNTDSILQDDDLPSEPPIKKPVLGLYLVGWGVALIICGLLAATNVREYSSPSHCFLRSGPALSALYGPFAVFLLFLIVHFLLVRCAIYNLDLSHGGHLSEGTQATEHVDLDLLEPNFSGNPDTRSVRSYSSKTASSETEDNERSPLAQLKAYVIFLFLFLISWLSCAFATVPPLESVPYEADLFSGAYAICSITLSAFTLFYYCVARVDIRAQWIMMFRWMRRKRLLRPRTVCDTPPRVQIQPLPLPPVPNSESRAVSRSSSRSSGRTKSNSGKAATTIDLNESMSDRPSIVGGTKINNVNLITLHRAQYRSNVVPHIIENPTNAAEVFYNPHQSTVARKFFKRQRRDMMKRNNLQTKPPRDVNSDATSVFSEPRPLKSKTNAEQNMNMFGTNSKVNNTNIHVEHVRRSQKKNPNIFSDSGDDFDCISDVPIDKIVINAERLRKKEISRNRTKKKSNLTQEVPHHHHPNHQTPQMRTISQQCTLDYSSENPLSDSILDKSDLTSPLSPTKILPVSIKLTKDNIIEEGCGVAMETSMAADTTVHLSTRRENSPVDEAHHYAEIEELRSSESTIRGGRFGLGGKDSSLARLRSPSNMSRVSSASATDLDELYQQIRRGPANCRSRKGQHFGAGDDARPQRAYSSPFLSDSEATGFSDMTRNREEILTGSADVETTV